MFTPRPRSWWKKFADAFVGVWLGVRGQSSFVVHIVVAILVVAVAAAMGMTIERWGLLILCIAVVMAAEMFNSAIEILARAVDRKENALLRDALNIASSAVLIAAIGSAIVGAIIFLTRLYELLNDWQVL